MNKPFYSELLDNDDIVMLQNICKKPEFIRHVKQAIEHAIGIQEVEQKKEKHVESLNDLSPCYLAHDLLLNMKIRLRN